MAIPIAAPTDPAAITYSGMTILLFDWAHYHLPVLILTTVKNPLAMIIKAQNAMTTGFGPGVGIMM